MKILFAGPTLYGLISAGQRLPGTDIICRAPAQGGDIARAVLDGATAIGLVDGRYEDVAAPWHKEILFALSRGVRMYGAASMGALRAAECAAFGMMPVGIIAQRYLAGDLVDDAAVAQIHAPPELGCLPLSEALINAEATISAAEAAGAISACEAAALLVSARALFFKDRDYAAIVEDARFPPTRAGEIVKALAALRRDIKRDDALALIDIMQADRRPPETPASAWSFREPSAWRTFMAAVAADRSRGTSAGAL